jgi:Uma2 family endonuclease
MSDTFTVRDLEKTPDNGNRFELVEGMLLVSPAVGFRHQKVVAQLVIRLDAACPPGMHVLPAPFAVRLSESLQVLPDVLVARQEDLSEPYLSAAPVLAVEVMSPSSELLDLTNKKVIYERMGVPSYWVIDPLDPKLIVFELDESGSRYELVAEVEGDKAFEAAQPFAVRIVPADLLGGLA